MSGCAHFAFTVWLLAMQGTMSVRTQTGDDAKDAACVELSNLNRAELMEKTPGDVYLLLERRGLMSAYRDLTQTLYSTKRGTRGVNGAVWKCSELYRSIYIRGYEKTFKANNVSIYLTREKTTIRKTIKKMTGSKIQVCFVDRVKEPVYMPPNVYTDGKVLKFEKGDGCNLSPESCGELGHLPEGVYGLVYDNFPSLRADKSGLPVDLMKLLEEKNAMSENIEMTALINTDDKTGFSAAHWIDKFKKRFQAKGINIFYAQANFTYVQKKGMGFHQFVSGDTSNEWHHWFEYADTDVVGKDYVPNIKGHKVEYPKRYLTLHDSCKSGDTKEIAHYLAFYSGQTQWEKCGNVAGAIEREKKESPNCKCKALNHRVFCGDSLVAQRKFDIESVLSLKECDARRAYCSVKSCRPPTVPGDRP